MWSASSRCSGCHLSRRSEPEAPDPASGPRAGQLARTMQVRQEMACPRPVRCRPGPGELTAQPPPVPPVRAQERLHPVRPLMPGLLSDDPAVRPHLRRQRRHVPERDLHAAALCQHPPKQRPDLCIHPHAALADISCAGPRGRDIVVFFHKADSLSRPPRITALLTCGTPGGLERVRVAGLGVCRLPVADLRADTGSAWGPGRRRRSGGSAPCDPAVGRGGRLGAAILL
jgi:hypothetical protein